MNSKMLTQGIHLWSWKNFDFFLQNAQIDICPCQQNVEAKSDRKSVAMSVVSIPGHAEPNASERLIAAEPTGPEIVSPATKPTRDGIAGKFSSSGPGIRRLESSAGNQRWRGFNRPSNHTIWEKSDQIKQTEEKQFTETIYEWFRLIIFMSSTPDTASFSGGWVEKP